MHERLKLLGKNFIWRVGWNLLSSSPLKHEMDSCCPYEVESMDHLFLTCHFLRMIWRESFWPMNTLKFANRPILFSFYFLCLILLNESLVVIAGSKNLIVLVGAREGGGGKGAGN
jgi:hypothetical protein